ncbi:MAG: hypothetical protein GX829_09355 [Clostridium sp.]|nr:hypothetical protein [Clostridium sp.]
MRNFKKDLIKILVAVIVLFLSASAIDTLSDIIVFKRNQEMLVNYQKINSSIINYDTSKVSFQLYSRTRVKKTLEDYEKSTKATVGILTELAPAFAQSERSQMDYRIVTQMLEHRNELIESYNSYIVTGLKIEKLAKSMIPMYIVMTITLLIITFVPDLVMTLPRILMN